MRTPRAARVLDGSAPTLVLHACGKVAADIADTKAELAAVAGTADGLDPGDVLRTLAARGANEVQVEAGPTLAGALFAAGLVDELLLYVAPVLLGGDARPLFELPPLTRLASGWRLRLVEQCQVGADLRLLLRPEQAVPEDR